MTGAEFRVVREFLGLTTAWMAAHLGVAERTVHRWEGGAAAVPDGVRLQVEQWETDTARTVDLGIESLPEGAGVLTYRTDADYRAHEDGQWTASWHRAVVARIAQKVPGLTITYAPPASTS